MSGFKWIFLVKTVVIMRFKINVEFMYTKPMAQKRERQTEFNDFSYSYCLGSDKCTQLC